jgi:hypothetical protein
MRKIDFKKIRGRIDEAGNDEGHYCTACRQNKGSVDQDYDEGVLARLGIKVKSWLGALVD